MRGYIKYKNARVFLYFAQQNLYRFASERREPDEHTKVEGDFTSRIHDLAEGTEITVIYRDSIPEDGQIYYEEGAVIMDDEAEFSIQKVDAGYYQYIPYVVDIYGNIYYGQTAIVFFDGEKSTIHSIAEG